ncbi:hypothetical protein CYY_006621 [Polysphondylium violaceum]|uniref:Glutathione S-transferase n=1 Tax=Polysphondylium violaceum TaxID=133409 RepID=A0A8J4PQ13_9MYCE|nr:hypothetical protein CYY_006621 [Polysphondylium violaceum]
MSTPTTNNNNIIASALNSTLPTIVYFRNRGKAEISRLLLAYFNVEFLDARVETIDDELRQILPYSQLPIYKEGEFVLAQSSAIARYLAEKYDFIGKTLQEKAIAHEIVDAIWDLVVPIVRASTDADKEKVKSLIQQFLTNWEKRIEKYTYIAQGDGYTYADLAIYFAYDYVSFLGYSNETQGYPKLESLKQHFETIPSIKRYIESRPVTKF